MAVRISRLVKRMWRPFGVAIDSFFDWRLGIKTSGHILLHRLGLSKTGTQDCVWYQPSPPSGVVRSLASICLDLSRFTFVDFGAGRGRVLLLAARLPFRQVVGVEFSAQLCDDATKNLVRLFPDQVASGRVRIVCEDARTFAFPETDVCAYMFTPFKGNVLTEVLARLRNHSLKGFRVIILYCGRNKGAIEALDSLRWVKRDVGRCFSWIDPMHYKLLVYDSGEVCS